MGMHLCMHGEHQPRFEPGSASQRHLLGTVDPSGTASVSTAASSAATTSSSSAAGPSSHLCCPRLAPGCLHHSSLLPTAVAPASPQPTTSGRSKTTDCWCPRFLCQMLSLPTPHPPLIDFGQPGHLAHAQHGLEVVDGQLPSLARDRPDGKPTSFVCVFLFVCLLRTFDAGTDVDEPLEEEL